METEEKVAAVLDHYGITITHDFDDFNNVEYVMYSDITRDSYDLYVAKYNHEPSWSNSLDHTFYKFIIMTKQDKLDAIKSLHKMIIELKSNPSIENKKTIQSLQQKLDELTL